MAQLGAVHVSLVNVSLVPVSSFLTLCEEGGPFHHSLLAKPLGGAEPPPRSGGQFKLSGVECRESFTKMCVPYSVLFNQ